jgi:hypothetical protein
VKGKLKNFACPLTPPPFPNCPKRTGKNWGLKRIITKLAVGSWQKERNEETKKRRIKLELSSLRSQLIGVMG